jgi:hypothetical protein
MNQQIEIKLKSKIKKELIVYYDILRSNVDINYIKNDKLETDQIKSNYSTPFDRSHLVYI